MEIPQNYHAFALFDPPKMDILIMIPVKLWLVGGFNPSEKY